MNITNMPSDGGTSAALIGGPAILSLTVYCKYELYIFFLKKYYEAQRTKACITLWLYQWFCGRIPGLHSDL